MENQVNEQTKPPLFKADRKSKICHPLSPEFDPLDEELQKYYLKWEIHGNCLQWLLSSCQRRIEKLAERKNQANDCWGINLRIKWCQQKDQW